MLAFYAGPTGDRNIYVLDIVQGLVRQLTFGGDGAGPSFSPDGQWIAFAAYFDSDLEVYIMRPDGSEITQLTSNTYSDWQPRWGP
jgi:TolB protein